MTELLSLFIEFAHGLSIHGFSAPSKVSVSKDLYYRLAIELSQQAKYGCKMEITNMRICTRAGEIEIEKADE